MAAKGCFGCCNAILSSPTMWSALKLPEINVRVKLQALFLFPVLSGNILLWHPLLSQQTHADLPTISNQNLFNSEEDFWVNRASHHPERFPSTSSTITPTSSLILRCFLLSLSQKNCGKHFISSNIHFGMKHNKLFLPLSSARVKRAKTTEEIFIFHSCSLHKLPVKCLKRKEAPGFLLLFFTFFSPSQRSVIWNIGRSVSTQNLPLPLPAAVTHSWNTFGRLTCLHTHNHMHMHAEQTGTDRWACTRTNAHTHTPCKWVGNVISCAGCRGRRGVLWRLTPSKSHFQLWTTSRRRQKSGLLFWNTHT